MDWIACISELTEFSPKISAVADSVVDHLRLRGLTVSTQPQKRIQRKMSSVVDFSLSASPVSRSDIFLTSLLSRARYEAGIVEDAFSSPPLLPTALTQLAIVEPLRLPSGYAILLLRARELLRDGLVV